MTGKVSTLVLDAGPLINQTREELFAQAQKLVSTPAVVREIKDEAARQRLALWKDELVVQQPSSTSIKHVTEFAKKTGDALVLSTQDIEVVALAYELHPDKTRLRSSPIVAKTSTPLTVTSNSAPQKQESAADNANEKNDEKNNNDDNGWEVARPKARRRPKMRSATNMRPQTSANPKQDREDKSKQAENDASGDVDSDESDWSDDGWITAENLEETLRRDGSETEPLAQPVDVAVSTRDFAVQNVAMQIGIELLNDQGLKIKQLRNYMQRCHACFKLVPLGPQGKREFCPRCGGHTLTRVTVSVHDGELRVHLKANMQWKTRGDRYTLGNPQSRSSRRQRHPDIQSIELYAEDQPEYIKAKKLQQRAQRHNEKTVEDWIGPSTVDSAVSPFVAKRDHTINVRVGRGRHANAKKK